MYKISLKFLLASKRSKAIFDISLIAIGIDAISKKVISYPTGSFIPGSHELTLNTGITKFLI
jgi:hypothetical protein